MLGVAEADGCSRWQQTFIMGAATDWKEPKADALQIRHTETEAQFGQRSTARHTLVQPSA
jgi:hypothetical protein